LGSEVRSGFLACSRFTLEDRLFRFFTLTEQILVANRHRTGYPGTDLAGPATLTPPSGRPGFFYVEDQNLLTRLAAGLPVGVEFLEKLELLEAFEVSDAALGYAPVFGPAPEALLGRSWDR
jgi:hypothetical protein